MGKKQVICFEITLENGNTFRAITGDLKADAHTDENRTRHLKDGSVLEFLVNVENRESPDAEKYPVISSRVKSAGDMSKCPNSNMYGEILTITMIENNEVWKKNK